MSETTSAGIRTTRAADALGPRTLERLLADRRVALVLAGLVAGAGGLLSDLVMPRGPATALHGLETIAFGLVIGGVAGVLGRTRWAFVVAALAFMVAVELGRIGNPTPSVGPIRLDNSYGIIAFVLGRGLHGLLLLPALALGMALGPMLFDLVVVPATPRRGRGLGHAIRTTALALVVGALAVLVALPTSTPPILGADGRPVPGSIAELATVTLGGVEQSVMIRAANPDKPVLLYLSGGPGQSDIAISRVLSSGWTNDFVFVDWDQRGTGKSYAAMDPLSTFTLDRAVNDTIELSDYLRTRFAEQKIYLMGESYGTILGVLAAQQRPDLYYAWIGSGQMVNIRETDSRIYADLTGHAASSGDTALAAKLAEIGQPPYRDTPWSNALVMGWYDELYKDYTPSAGYRARGESSGLDNWGLLGSEYSLVEKANVLRGLIDTFSILYPQVYDVDLRKVAARMEVPVWVLDGAAELAGRREPMLQWFDQLQAPIKQRVTYQDAAHSVAFEQADAVLDLFKGTILPATYGK